MPVPLNAFVDVVESWFTERLGYLVNDSVPVRPEYIGKPCTVSDIDLVAKHPKKKQQQIQFDSGRTIKLNSNLLIECKGWFDFTRTVFTSSLIYDLSLLNKYKKNYLPRKLNKKEHHYTFFFLREEVFNKGKQIFGTGDFQRVIIGPFLLPTRNSIYTIPELILKYEDYGICIIEMKDIIDDLFKFIQNSIKQKKQKQGTEDFDKLRKTYALEMLHLVNTYCKVERKEQLEK